MTTEPGGQNQPFETPPGATPAALQVQILAAEHWSSTTREPPHLAGQRPYQGRDTSVSYHWGRQRELRRP
jgi:hypothetical protein